MDNAWNAFCQVDRVRVLQGGLVTRVGSETKLQKGLDI